MEKAIGRVTHYFGHVGAAGVALLEPLRIGDRLHIVGHTTDCTMTVERMQIDHRDVSEAKPGDDLAVHMPTRVREHDEIRKVVGET